MFPATVVTSPPTHKIATIRIACLYAEKNCIAVIPE
jgi:hypothetical protein